MMPVTAKLSANAIKFGQSERIAWRSSRSLGSRIAGNTIPRIKRVIANANTPSVKASKRLLFISSQLRRCALAIVHPYAHAMFDVADSLRGGLESAATRLQQAQRIVARANAGEGGRSADAAMAQTAQAAIFDEALLGAMHARLEELKAVTK